MSTVVPLDEHRDATTTRTPGMSLPDCARCGHPADWHRHDDVADEHPATDPECPFRCLGYDCEAEGFTPGHCDCPDYLEPKAIPT
jgi:hypothetical protein